MRALWVTVTGCAQTFGPDDPAHRGLDDAAPMDVTDAPADMMIDVTPPGTTCLQKWALGPTFPPPTPITEVNTTASEGDPFLTNDGLRLYFQRTGDIHFVQRSSTSGAFGTAQFVDDLSSANYEGKVYISDDQTRAFFASQQPSGSGGMDLWRGVDGPGENWSVDQSYVSSVNSSADDHDPHLSPDLLHLYWAPAVASVQTIHYATRSNVSNNFTSMGAITELEGTGAEADPTLTANERVIVYTSTASGKRRMMFATRNGMNDSFTVRGEVNGLNANQGNGDSDAHITADGCTIYFASDRSGAGDIYVSTML